jgi:hypothetical protein
MRGGKKADVIPHPNLAVLACCSLAACGWFVVTLTWASNPAGYCSYFVAFSVVAGAIAVTS